MANRLKKDLSDSKISVEELLSLIPETLIEDLTESLGVDDWVKKLKANHFFKLILYSLLSNERISLRILENDFKDPLFRLLAPALEADEVRWTGIRDRLKKIDSEFFQKLYESVYTQAKELYGGDKLAGYNIKKYDSTMIATFSHLLDGMKVGNTQNGKRQVKFTTEFSDDFLIQMEFFKDQAHLSEETALKEVIEKANSEESDIHVFDKGLKSRQTFASFDDDDIKFVTRVHENPRYEIVGPYWTDDMQQDSEDLEFVQDSIVKVYETGHKIIDKEFRLIQYHIKHPVKGKSKTLSFLTNVWDIDAASIAQIYKSRWDIEVLFRFMKQEMNLTHFVCNDPNAIKVMLYCTMIASMLILIYKKKNNIKSYKKAKISFFKELVYLIFLEILDNPNELKRLKSNLQKYIKRE